MTKSLLKEIIGLPSVLNARLSPIGSHVAFEQRANGVSTTFLMSTSEPVNFPIPILIDGESANLVSWSRDSGSLVVSQDHNGNERSVLFRVAIDHVDRPDQLTDDNPNYFLRGGDISPDGRYLYYGANYDFESKKVIAPTWIYKHNLATREIIPIAKPNFPAFTYPQINQQGTHLIYGRKDKHPSGRQFYIIDNSGNEVGALDFGDRIKVFARWFPDGRNILFITESFDGKSKDYNSLGSYDLVTREIEWIVNDPQTYFEHAWVSNSGTTVIISVENGQSIPILSSKSNGHRVFSRLVDGLSPQGQTPDKRWIGIFSKSSNPSQLVSFEEQHGPVNDLRYLLEPAKDLNARFVTAEPISWKSTDRTNVFGWLYKSPINQGRAIIHIHGGPTAHAEDKFNVQIQYYALRGYNVLDVNYRGSTGYGSLFRERINEDGWGGREQEDIMTGAQELIARGLASPLHIGVTGLSYGGYSTWCQATRYSSQIYGAAVPINGMTDLTLDYQLTRPDMQPITVEMMGGTPSQLPDKYFDRSPINFVAEIQCPLLIVQGLQDPNVPAEHVAAVKEKLDALHIQYESLVFEDEGHVIVKPENLIRLYFEIANFFDRYLFNY